MTDRIRPDRNLAMELARVTEAAALAAGRWIGRGDKNGADQAAVDAMRFMIDSVSMDGIVVIGEGEKDEAPMLYNGEAVGNGRGRRSTWPSIRSTVPPDEHGAAERRVGDRARRAHDVLPRRGRLHGEGRDRAEGGRTDRHHRAAGGERPARGEGEGKKIEEMLRDDPRSAPARADRRGRPRRRRARLPDHGRRRGGAISAAPLAPASTC